MLFTRKATRIILGLNAAVNIYKLGREIVRKMRRITVS